jgi:hypothetical protein
MMASVGAAQHYDHNYLIGSLSIAQVSQSFSRSGTSSTTARSVVAL